MFGLELIFAELFQREKSKREVKVIPDYASLLPALDKPFLVTASGVLSNHFALVNQGVGIIDAIIFNAVQKNERLLWTLVKNLKQVVGYDLLFYPKVVMY